MKNHWLQANKIRKQTLNNSLLMIKRSLRENDVELFNLATKTLKKSLLPIAEDAIDEVSNEGNADFVSKYYDMICRELCAIPYGHLKPISVEQPANQVYKKIKTILADHLRSVIQKERQREELLAGTKKEA